MQPSTHSRRRALPPIITGSVSALGLEASFGNASAAVPKHRAEAHSNCARLQMQRRRRRACGFEQVAGRHWREPALLRCQGGACFEGVEDDGNVARRLGLIGRLALASEAWALGEQRSSPTTRLLTSATSGGTRSWTASVPRRRRRVSSRALMTTWARTRTRRSSSGWVQLEARPRSVHATNAASLPVRVGNRRRHDVDLRAGRARPGAFRASQLACNPRRGARRSIPRANADVDRVADAPYTTSGVLPPRLGQRSK